jgi:hypothetical protein
MQNVDNTGCSENDATNMIVIAIASTTVQRLRRVIQCKTEQHNTLDIGILQITLIFGVNHTENTLHLLKFKVLTMETCGAVYTGKSVLEY